MGKITHSGRGKYGNEWRGKVTLDDGRQLTWTINKFGRNYEWDRSDGAYGAGGTLQDARDGIAQG